MLTIVNMPFLMFFNPDCGVFKSYVFCSLVMNIRRHKVKNLQWVGGCFGGLWVQGPLPLEAGGLGLSSQRLKILYFLGKINVILGLF